MSLSFSSLTHSALDTMKGSALTQGMEKFISSMMMVCKISCTIYFSYYEKSISSIEVKIIVNVAIGKFRMFVSDIFHL